MKRGRIYHAARRENYNVLAMGQHLDDLAERWASPDDNHDYKPPVFFKRNMPRNLYSTSNMQSSRLLHRDKWKVKHDAFYKIMLN